MKEKEREHLCGAVSAKTIEALAPMIREAQDFAHSEYAFFNQIPTQRFGVYLLPAEKGAVVVAVDYCRLLAVHDEEGVASRAMKVYLPDGLLEAATTKRVALVHEDGGEFFVDAEPKPRLVFLHDLLGMVSVDGDEKKYPGVFGTWTNGDRGNVIAADTYRAEPADPEPLRKVISDLLSEPGEAAETLDLDITQLSAMSHAAKCLGTAVRVTASRKAVVVNSYDGRLFGVLMALLPSVLGTDANKASAAILSPVSPVPPKPF